MSSDFIKFPSTPHLILLGGNQVRDDKVLSEVERRDFLSHEVVVEEKVDGANMGVSFSRDGDCRIQNRGNYLCEPYSGQWNGLSAWMTLHRDALFDALTDRFILYGEWCRAVHSVFYVRLPDWFLGFDVYDRENAVFLDTQHRNTLLLMANLKAVPKVAQGTFDLEGMKGLLRQSRVGDVNAEGLYLRRDGRGSLTDRAKLVRPEFIQAIGEHWSRSGIRYNVLDVEGQLAGTNLVNGCRSSHPFRALS